MSAFFEQVFEHIPIIIAVVDTNGVVTHINDAWKQFADANGLDDPKYGVGSNYLDVSNVPDGPYAQEACVGLNAVLAGEQDAFEMVYPCDGPTQPRWYRLSISPVMHAGARHAVIAHEDVTQTTLREQSRAQALLTAVPDLMFRISAKGVFTDYHDGGPGTLTQDFIGKHIRDVLPALAGVAMNYIRTALQTGDMQFMNYQLPNPDGTTHFFEARMVPNGKDEVVSIVRDITETVLLEQTLSWELTVTDSLNSLQEPLITYDDPRKLADQVLALAMFLTESQRGCVIFVDPATGEMVQHQYGHQEQATYDLSGVLGQSLRTQEAHIYNEDVPHPAFERLLLVPVFDKDRVIAQISLGNASQPYTDEQLVAVGRIASVFALGLIRLQTLNELAASEARYRQFFENHAAVQLLIDPRDGQIVDANEAAAAYYGAPKDTLLTMSIKDINILPDSKVQAHMAESARREITHFEFQHRLASGERRHVEVYASPVELDGQTYLYSIIHDISDRWQAQHDLEQSERRYRSLIASMAEGVVLHDREGKIQTWNDSALRILGVTADQMQGKTSMDPQWQTIHEDGSPFPGQDHPVMPTLRTGKPQTNVIMGIRKHGDMVTWIRINTQPIEIDGQMIGVVVTFGDITELRDSEARFQRLAATARDAIVTSDDQGRIIFWNDAAETTFGYTAGEVLGKNIQVIMPAAQRSTHANSFERHLRTGEERIIGHTIEIDGLHKDGTEMPIEVSLSTWFESGKQYFTAIMRDITTRREAENQRFQLELARAKSRLLTEFIEKAAHEFRTPLSVIGSSVYLMDRVKTEADREKKRERIQDSIDDLTTLLDNMLEMVRLDQDPTFDKTINSMNRIVEVVLTKMDDQIQEAGLTLVQHPHPDDPTARVNAQEIAIALEHILDNAIQFTPAGGAITVSAVVNHAHVGISVADTGPGIPLELREKVFERFFRGDSVHTTRGFGLGLPIAHKIIQIHGGEMELESDPGAGTVFTLWLPANR